MGLSNTACARGAYSAEGKSPVGTIQGQWRASVETSGDGICRLGLRVAVPEWWSRRSVHSGETSPAFPRLGRARVKL